MCYNINIGMTHLCNRHIVCMRTNCTFQLCISVSFGGGVATNGGLFRVTPTVATFELSFYEPIERDGIIWQ